MVRTYKRKTSRAEIPEDNISKAIEEILGGASIRSAAAKYDLTKSMLHKRMSKMKASSENSEICVSVPGTTSHKNKEKIQPYNSKYTSRQIFTKEEEAMLEEYLIQSSKMQFGLTYLQIREFAYSYAVKLCRPLPSNWTTQKMAGTDWMKSFMKRHPALSLRKPESTSIGRNISFNQYNISSFFDNLDKVLSKHKFSSSRIINVDESGISTVLPAPKVVAPTGCKQVGQTVSGERGEQVTFVGIVSAAGEAFPPVYIFPRVRFKEAFLTGSPPGSIGLAIQNGWMTRDGFLQVMKHIQEVTAASKENPILVLLDNHDSHTSLDLVVFCRENGIVLLTFPPHCTHRIQPLDIAVFGPFKSRCKTAFNSWMASNPGKPITIYNIGYLSAKPFIESFSQNNICAGFEKSGIFPLNRDVFTDEDFMPSNVTEIHMVSISTDGNLEKSTIPGPSSRLDLASIESDIQSSTSSMRFSPDPTSIESSTATCSSHPDNNPGFVKAIHPSTSNQCYNVSDSVSTASNENCRYTLSQLNSGTRRSVQTLSPEMVRPFPKADRQKPKNCKRKRKSTVLTDTPEKIRLEEEFLRLQEKDKGKSRTTKKRCSKNNQTIKTNFPSSVGLLRSKLKSNENDSTDSDTTTFDSTSENEIDNDVMDSAGCSGEIKVNDYVIVKFQSKKMVKHYVGQVDEKIDENSFEINFLKRKSDGKFVFPNEVDKSEVLIKDVVMKLPKPRMGLIGGTMRASGFLTFSIDTESYNLG